MTCNQRLHQAQAKISEYGTIRKNFQRHVATYSHDARARQYEDDMARVTGELQTIYDDMRRRNCPELASIPNWPAGVRQG